MITVNHLKKKKNKIYFLEHHVSGVNGTAIPTANFRNFCWLGRKIARNVVAMATEAPAEVATEVPEIVETIQDAVSIKVIF